MKHNDVYLIKASFLKALANPIRLQLLELLRHGEQTVGQVARTLSVGQPTVSRHLAILKQEGLVRAHSRGTSVFYRIQSQEVFQLLRQLAEVLKRRFQMDQKFLKI